MKVTQTVYYYQVADDSNYLVSIYGKHFCTFHERKHDVDIILLKTEERTFDFPELSSEEIVARQLDTLYTTRDTIREEHQAQMKELAERIRNLQLLTHSSGDYISREDNIE